jgi:hypothetical protein
MRLIPSRDRPIRTTMPGRDRRGSVVVDTLGERPQSRHVFVVRGAGSHARCRICAAKPSRGGSSRRDRRRLESRRSASVTGLGKQRQTARVRRPPKNPQSTRTFADPVSTRYAERVISPPAAPSPVTLMRHFAWVASDTRRIAPRCRQESIEIIGLNDALGPRQLTGCKTLLDHTTKGRHSRRVRSP